jgi:holo-[acyl-carrier protein] synthase
MLTGTQIEPALDLGSQATPGGVCVGIDLVDVSRIQTMLHRDPNFADGIFTRKEIETCRRRRNPAQHFAARFAAKEATLKALGLGLGVPPVRRRLREIEINSGSNGVQILLHGGVARFARKRGYKNASASLSHDAGIALAYVGLARFAEFSSSAAVAKDER